MLNGVREKIVNLLVRIRLEKRSVLSVIARLVSVSNVSKLLINQSVVKC